MHELSEKFFKSVNLAMNQSIFTKPIINQSINQSINHYLGTCEVQNKKLAEMKSMETKQNNSNQNDKLCV